LEQERVIEGVQWGEFVGELFIEIGQTRQRINARKTLELRWDVAKDPGTRTTRS
jgi:hypothetical protein